MIRQLGVFPEAASRDGGRAALVWHASNEETVGERQLVRRRGRSGASSARPGAEVLAPAHADAEHFDGAVLRLLADPLRARSVELLGEQALCTSHLVEMTGAKQTNISNHLKLLRDADLVRTEPCSRFTYYLLNAEPLRALAG